MPVWERAVHLVCCASFVNLYQILCFPFGIKGGM